VKYKTSDRNLGQAEVGALEYLGYQDIRSLIHADELIVRTPIGQGLRHYFLTP